MDLRKQNNVLYTYFAKIHENIGQTARRLACKKATASAKIRRLDRPARLVKLGLLLKSWVNKCWWGWRISRIHMRIFNDVSGIMIYGSNKRFVSTKTMVIPNSVSLTWILHNHYYHNQNTGHMFWNNFKYWLGGQIMHNIYWCPHKVLKATGKPKH